MSIIGKNHRPQCGPHIPQYIDSHFTCKKTKKVHDKHAFCFKQTYAIDWSVANIMCNVRGNGFERRQNSYAFGCIQICGSECSDAYTTHF